MQTKCSVCGAQIVIPKDKFSQRCKFCKEGYAFLPEDRIRETLEKCAADFEIEGETLIGYTGEGGRVTIPPSVRHIGERAFENKRITEIFLPASVESVGNRAFQGCAQLVSVTVSGGVKSIGEGAFRNCASLNCVAFEIEGEELKIGDRAFEGCAFLTEINFPDRVVCIGEEAFRGCVKLKKAVVGKPDVGDGAFADSPKFRLYTRDKKKDWVNKSAFYDKPQITVNFKDKHLIKEEEAAPASADEPEEETPADAINKEISGKKREEKKEEKLSEEKRLERIVENYKRDRDITPIKHEIALLFSGAKELKDFDLLKKFIIAACGARLKVGGDDDILDKLQEFARSFDNKNNSFYRGDGRLYLALIDVDVDKIMDKQHEWDDLLDAYVKNDPELFNKYGQSLIKFIADKGGTSYAIEIYNRYKKNPEMERAYLGVLLTDKRICDEVLNDAFFRTKRGIQFADRLEKFVKKNYKAEDKISFEEKPVWKNILKVRAELARKKRKKTVIALSCTLAVLLLGGGGAYLFLNAPNPATVDITGSGIVNAVYGEKPDLSGYKVTYSKFSGQKVEISVTADMLENYNPEQIGNQRVNIKYGSQSLPVTLSLSPAQLLSPVLTQSGNALSWTQVEHADGYLVYITQSATAAGDTGYSVAECTYDLRTLDLSGSFYAYVVAVSGGDKYSASVKSESIPVTKLAAVKSVSYTGGKIVWDEVAGADHYMVTLNGTSYPNLNRNYLETALSDGNVYTVTVNAYPASPTTVESVSGEISLSVLNPVHNFTHVLAGGAHRIGWSDGADGNCYYLVSVDGGEAQTVYNTYFDLPVSLAGGAHTVSVTKVSNAENVSPSSPAEYRVDTSVTLEISGGRLSWSAAGTVSLYADGEVLQQASGGIALDALRLAEGRHTLCVAADGAFGYSIEVNKLATPVLSVTGGLLSCENHTGGTVYYLDGVEFNGELNGLSAGTHTLTAENRAVAENDIPSGTSAPLTVTKLRAPEISLGADQKLTCTNVQSGTQVVYYYNGNNPFNGDFSTITVSGEVTVTAVMRSDDENVLDSERSAAKTFTRRAAPVLSYDVETRRLTATALDGGAESFTYYNNGVEFNGDLTRLGSGVFVITAICKGSSADDTLSSPLSNAVTVFFTNMTLSMQRPNGVNNAVTLYMDTDMQSFNCTVSFDLYDESGFIETVEYVKSVTDERGKEQTCQLKRGDRIATRVVATVTVTSEATADVDVITKEWTA